MAAVNLPRLRIQSAKLMGYFDAPDGFLRELHNLLDNYADRTIRPSAITSPVLVLPSYRVPTVVLRQLEIDLGVRAQDSPDQTITLADKCWDDGYFESRSLAAYLLGLVPPTDKRYLIRLNSWVAETREPNINRILISISMARLRKEEPELYLSEIERWSHPAQKKMWNSAINALLPLLKDKSFHNLPAIYKIVSPIIESAPATMQNSLSILICALYESSPIETTFFVRQLLTLSTTPHTLTNIRRIYPTLPDPLQKDLREAVRLPK
jgi:hypothetical protein